MKKMLKEMNRKISMPVMGNGSARNNEIQERLYHAASCTEEELWAKYKTLPASGIPALSTLLLMGDSEDGIIFRRGSRLPGPAILPDSQVGYN